MSIDDTCRYPSSEENLHDGPVVIASPDQVLTGYPVGSRVNTAVCSNCNAPLHETDIVFAYAYRCVESAQWNVPRLYCYGCAPDTIKSPTLSTTEVLVGGRLGVIKLPTSRTHRLCLTELAVRAYSYSTEGYSP